MQAYLSTRFAHSRAFSIGSTTARRAASPSIPAKCEHEHSSPEPYWPRLARALVLMFFAVSLHVWGVRSPEPQEPIYATLAARLVTLALASPPLPLAPPLRFITNRPSSSEPRVTLRTSLLNVPVVPGPPAWSSAAVLDPTLIARRNERQHDRRDQRQRDRRNDAALRSTGRPIPRTSLRASRRRRHLRRHRPTMRLQSRAGRAPAGADDRCGGRDPSARDSNPIDRSIAGSPRLVRKPCCAPSRSERAGSGAIRRTSSAARRRASSPWCSNTRARSSGSTSMPPRRSIHPSTIAGFGRSFEDVEAQRFQLASCGVSFSSSGHDANALCLGNSTFRPKVGSRVLRYTDQVWEFNLARDGSGWQILEARIQ